MTVRYAHVSLVVTLAFAAALVGCGKGDETAAPADTDTDTDTDTDADTDTDTDVTRFTVLHTNDWQSHMLGWGPNAEYTPDTTGDDGTVGGMARLKTLADEIRGATTDPVVLYDGGDWMAGALFQLLGTTEAAELQMAQLVGYDAMTLGNHEFDWGPQVLAQIIEAGDAHGVTVPLLSANTFPNLKDPGDDALEALFDSGRITATHVHTLDNGVIVGLFGIVGDEAASISPGVAPASFGPMVEATQAAVDALQAQGVDIIIGITHNGVTDDPATSPDALLAEAVDGIDVIVGGHSHTPLFAPVEANGTIIVQAGAYTRYLGELVLVQDGDDWTAESYTLHELDDTIPGDPAVTALVDGWITALEEGPLLEIGRTFYEPIVSVPGDVRVDQCAESGLGNLITDAYVWATNEARPDLPPVQFAFEAQGVIRDDLLAGATGVESFADLFRILPLGVGTDAMPGYALVDFWVDAGELLDACEVTASLSPDYGCNYFIEVSNLRCTLDMERSSFNRARTIDLWDGSAWVPIDTSSGNTTLYHITVDSYVAGLMGILGGLTFDAIRIDPKDQNGAPLDLDLAVFDADAATPGVQELKLWDALVRYSEAQPVDGALPRIPDRYLGPEGRIVGYE